MQDLRGPHKTLKAAQTIITGISKPITSVTFVLHQLFQLCSREANIFITFSGSAQSPHIQKRKFFEPTCAYARWALKSYFLSVCHYTKIH